jgi:hypothetical protein
MQRAARERCEARAEYRPGIHQIPVRHDPFGAAAFGLVE